MDKTIKEFWEKDNLRNIKPTTKEFPEGFDPRSVLQLMTAGIAFTSVIDFGCGYGRLCEAWPVDKYIGVDISDVAIKEAKKRNPKYTFTSYQKPPADLYVAYTVFLHLSDEQLREELKGIQSEYFLIAEILGSEWANNGRGNPPTYNRDDYSIMKEFGYKLVKEIKKPYVRYVGSRIAKDKNTDISFLLWSHNENII